MQTSTSINGEVNDTQTGMPSGIPEGAMCVQRFDDSLNSAIHITFRISLRSSSMPEPRDPLLKVLFYFCLYSDIGWVKKSRWRASISGPLPPSNSVSSQVYERMSGDKFINDPSAGSPTERSCAVTSLVFPKETDYILSNTKSITHFHLVCEPLP